MLKKIILFLCFGCLMYSGVHAQSISRKVISSTGGTAIGGGSQITFSIGETMTPSLSGGGNIITQGFQQPGEEIHTGSVSVAICAGSSITIPYSAIDIGGGNTFTAQISDASGSFAVPVSIGTQTGNASGIIGAVIPVGTPPGSNYRIRVISSSPLAIGNDNGTNIVVNALPVLSFTSTHVTCNGAGNGTATALATGGTPAYNYLWGTGSTNAGINSLSPGNYPVTVTDANGCSSSSAVSITEPGVLTVNGALLPVACKGSQTGSISLSVAGGTAPFQYLWNNGSTVQNRTSLASGTYIVTVTDGQGCTKKTSFVIAQPATKLVLNVSKTNIRCFGGAGGKATVSPSGGLGPYSYSWNTIPVQTTAGVSGLTAGVYSCSVTDANGCTKTATITITQPAEIVVVPTQSNVSTNGGNDGSASVSVSGGVTPYAYYWNTVPSSTNSAVTGLAAGTYTCKVTDSKGCVKKTTFIITQPGARTGMHEAKDQLTVYPNPTDGMVNLILSAGGDENYSLSVYDLSGKEFIRQTGFASAGDNPFSLNLGILSKGIYFLKLQSDRAVFVERIVLQ